MRTSQGEIFMRLFAEKTPLTVANFINLSLKGFYNGLRFHRVIRDFIIQTGCPIGNGAGNAGYFFEDEICPALSHSCAGKVSMANFGPNTNSCQFFITRTSTPWLDGKHTLFGEVTKGIEVVQVIQYNDIIHEIIPLDDPNFLLANFSEQIKFWDQKIKITMGGDGFKTAKPI
ncbi:MAG: peptidylprolyl isomerase [Chthoniobacterales bacterium]|nr:peptidylprolyl isomerase [Chthoniobacterales bacterium]